MFDPRTLPSLGAASEFGLFVLWASLLADMITTRIGIWYHGWSEGNSLMKWFTKSAGTTFVDGLVRMAAVVLVGSLDAKFHFPAAFIYALSSVGFYGAIKNFLKIKKILK